MSNLKPCYVCGVMTEVVLVRKPYKDGRIRCAEHRRQHREEFHAYWRDWKAPRYAPEQNRGGMNLVEDKESA
jgi:hypothetical protein